jgi:hypothetical protein
MFIIPKKPRNFLVKELVSSGKFNNSKHKNKKKYDRKESNRLIYNEIKYCAS